MTRRHDALPPTARPEQPALQPALFDSRREVFARGAAGERQQLARLGLRARQALHAIQCWQDPAPGHSRALYVGHYMHNADLALHLARRCAGRCAATPCC